MKAITYKQFENAAAKVLLARVQINVASVCMALRVSSVGAVADQVAALLAKHLRPHPTVAGCYVP